MTRRLIFGMGALLGALVIGLTAFKSTRRPQASGVQYMQINVLESVVQGGLGRSRMVITYPDGKREEVELDNYYSMMGINFGNIASNDQRVILKLNQFSAQGWEVVSMASGGAQVYFTKIVLVNK